MFLLKLCIEQSSEVKSSRIKMFYFGDNPQEDKEAGLQFGKYPFLTEFSARKRFKKIV